MNHFLQGSIRTFFSHFSAFFDFCVFVANFLSNFDPDFDLGAGLLPTVDERLAFMYNGIQSCVIHFSEELYV